MPITPAFASIDELPNRQPEQSIEHILHQIGVHDFVKLDNNENPLGASPKVATAIVEKLSQVNQYPDGHGMALKEQIADLLAVKTAQITLGNGINDLVNLLVYSFVNSSHQVVFSQFAFSFYAKAVKAVGATGVVVPAKNFAHDLTAMLASVKANKSCKMVFIGNPNNPTGLSLTSGAIRKFVSKIPNDVLVVIDEATIEYSPKYHSLDLLENYDNVVILRSFSKAYGLAGMRLGYAVSSVAVAEILNRVRPIFNVNILAQTAGVSALRDRQFLQEVRAFNQAQKLLFYQQFDTLGLEYLPSSANFIMVNVKNADIYRQLLLNGVVVRPLVEYGLPTWIRVSVGLAKDNERFLMVLTKVINQS